jgi:hypothetical protein
MGPCDISPFFFQAENALKGKRFEDADTIKENTTKRLSRIPKDSLKKMFPQQWQNRWHKCVATEGGYFEGD